VLRAAKQALGGLQLRRRVGALAAVGELLGAVDEPVGVEVDQQIDIDRMRKLLAALPPDDAQQQSVG
jgi:hypothetical protein